MSLTDAGGGWQNLAVDLAISNTSQTLMTPSLPDNPGFPAGSVSINEGRDYDLMLDIVYYDNKITELESLMVPTFNTLALSRSRQDFQSAG